MKTLLNTLKSPLFTSCLLAVLFSSNALQAQETFVCNDMVQVSLGANCTATIDADQILEGGPYCCYANYIVEIDNTPAGAPCNGPWIPAVLGLSDVGNTYCIRVRDPLFPGSQCIGNVQVDNIIGPTISCPANQTRTNDPGQCDYTVVASEFDPTAFNDNCPGATVAYKLISPINNSIIGTGPATLSGTVMALGTTIVRWTVTDVNNASASCSFSVQIDDNELPVITCPSNQVRIGDANDQYTATGIEFDPLTFFDNCPIYPVFSSLSGATNGSTQLSLAGQIFEAGTTTVTWFIAELLNPNFVNSTCSFDVDVQSTRSLIYIPNFLSNNVSVVNPATNLVTTTIPVGVNPVDARISPEGSRVYVVNRGSNTVSVINALTNSVISTINVGNSPSALELSPNGSRLYVTNSNSNTLSVINTTTNSVLTTIAMGTNPSHIEIKPDGSRIYVVNSGFNKVTVVDASTNSVVKIIGVGINPYFADLSSDGARLYVTNNATNNVSVINTNSNTVVATLGVGTSPDNIAVSPNNNRIYVPNIYANNVSVINAASNTVITNVPVGIHPSRVCTSPDGTRLYVSNHGSNSISVINTATNAVLTTINLADAPNEMRMNGDGSVLYVTNNGADKISVINTMTNTVSVVMAVGDAPFAISNFPPYSSTTPCAISSCPGSRIVNLNGACQLPVPDLTPEVLVSGGCLSFTQIPAAGTLLSSSNNQTHNITLTVAGATGNCVIVLTAKDAQAPSMTCPGNKTRNTEAHQCTYTAIGSELDPVAFSDNCAGSYINYSLSGVTTGSGSNTLAGVIFNKGITNVTWTAFQAGGNASYNCGPYVFTVVDNQAPSISCPANQTRGTSAATCTYVAAGSEFGPAAYNDNCAGATLTYTLSGVTGGNGSSLAGKVFNKGSTKVTWKATDAANKTATCTFQVTVNDTQAPVFGNCPNITINHPMTAPCKLIMPAINTLPSDNCSGTVTITQMPQANSILSVVHNQHITVVITAKDASNNISTCTRTVVAVDQTKPSITTCPANRTVSLNGACQMVVPDMRSQLVATDCTLPITVTQNPAQLSILSSGNNMQHQVTMIATDGAANSKTCFVTLTAQFQAGCLTGGAPALERFIDTENGSETLEGNADPSGMHVLPNPFTDQLRVLFHLEETTQVHVTLMDMTGRMLFHEKYERMEAGHQVIDWTTSDLPEGLYLVGLKRADQAWIYQKVLLMR